MNERIKLLADAATSYKEGLIEGKHDIEVFDKEKFAELILEDIDNIIVDLYHALPLEQAAILLTLDEQIKSHFYEVKE